MHYRKLTNHHIRHHHIKPFSIHLLDEGLSIFFPSQSVLGILFSCSRSPEVIDFIPPSLQRSTSWLTTIHGSPICYLGCPCIVLKASHEISPSSFSGFDDVHNVTNLGFAPYPLVCPMICQDTLKPLPFLLSLFISYSTCTCTFTVNRERNINQVQLQA